VGFAAETICVLKRTVERLGCATTNDLGQYEPIRSLAYFMPLIDELLAQPLPNGYLRLKLPRVQSAMVQKTTFSEDR
jgi:hypothetical protein